MQAYNARQEAKMRTEALKPPTTFPPSSASGGMPGDRSSYPDARDGYGAMGGAGFPGMGPSGMGPGGPGMGPGMGGGYGYGYGDFSGYGGMGMG